MCFARKYFGYFGILLAQFVFQNVTQKSLIFNQLPNAFMVDSIYSVLKCQAFYEQKSRSILYELSSKRDFFCPLVCSFSHILACFSMLLSHLFSPSQCMYCLFFELQLSLLFVFLYFSSIVFYEHVHNPNGWCVVT